MSEPPTDLGDEMFNARAVRDVELERKARLTHCLTHAVDPPSAADDQVAVLRKGSRRGGADARGRARYNRDGL